MGQAISPEAIRVTLDDFNSIPSSNGNGHVLKPGERRVKAVPASQIERKQVRWYANGRVPIGHVTVLGGYGGLGKSQWTCLLASKLSRGELGDPGVTLFATAEDDPDTTVVPRLEAVEANLDLIHFLHVETKEGEEGIVIPDDIPQIEEMAIYTGARLIVIDPLTAHLARSIDSHSDQSTRYAMTPLYRLAKSQQCAVVAVMHLNKSQGLRPLSRLVGSVAFGNAVRSVLLFDRDPDDVPRGNRRVLVHEKHNIGKQQPSLLYEVEEIVLPPVGNAPMMTTSRLSLLGECDYDGTRILDARKEPA